MYRRGLNMQAEFINSPIVDTNLHHRDQRSATFVGQKF